VPSATSPAPLRRLTTAEYTRTVRDLLALPASAPLPVDLPAEASVDGFLNNAEVQTLSGKHLHGYLDTAERAIAALLLDTKRRDAVVGCAPSGAARDACLRGFIGKVGRRAFRRPLTDAESAALFTLAAGATSEAEPYAGAGLALQALLTSSNFLFVVELGVPDAKRPGYVRLTGEELATRLALLVTGTGPSEALLDASAAGRLDTSEGLLAAARQLASDPRAAEVRRELYAGWLGLGQLAQIEPDRKRYPTFTEALRSAFAEETTRFLEELSTRSTGSLLDLSTADWTFVNGPLAKHYGLLQPTTWTRVTLPAGPRGAGLLTQASFLTATAPHLGVEPIKRGQFVRQALLCQILPPPPAGVPALDQVKVPANASERERLAAHRADPACAGCHALLEPIGQGLSQFDGIGALRTQDSRGAALDARGSLGGFDVPDFEGPRELGAKLRSSQDSARCAVTQFVRFASGHSETAEDRCLIDGLLAAWQSGAPGGPSAETHAALVEAFIKSGAFRYRHLPTLRGDKP
jgi:hypothetical protein